MQFMRKTSVLCATVENGAHIQRRRSEGMKCEVRSAPQCGFVWEAQRAAASPWMRGEYAYVTGNT